MKKFISIILAALLSVSLFACGLNNGEKESTDGTTGESSGEGSKLSIVCTTFPSYDWMKNILGERADEVELELLLDNGVDLHNYQATADDIVTIHNCDMFVYIGGVSDSWVEDVISEAANEDMVTVNLIKALGDEAKAEETIEGMEAEEEEEGEIDEHIWLSLENASELVEALSAALCRVDAENAGIYKNNAAAYIAQLDALDEKFEKAAENAKFKTVLFGDRFPFRYLVDDYDIKYYAAFAGCSAETEASFETVSFLAGKVDELSLPAVLKIEGSDGKIAETIASTAKSAPEIITLNSMQSTTSRDIESGVSYLSIMESNLDALSRALG